MRESQLLTLCVVAGFGLVLGIAWLYRSAYLDAVSVAKLWERRARAAGWCPPISEAKGRELMADLFPNSKFARPMGATPRLRTFAEYRALASRDHTTRHSVDAVTDSEAAREIMQFTVGGYEVDE